MRPGASLRLKTALAERKTQHQMTIQTSRAGVLGDSLGGFMANYCTLTNLMNNTGASAAATCAFIHD